MASAVVLVLAWNGRPYLPACLGALGAQQTDDRHAVLVVDNGSTDGSAELVQTEFPAVALLENGANLGFAGGNNVGLRALLDGSAPAPCDFVPDVVVLLNQDTVVAADWLSELLAVFDRRPHAAIAGCKMFFPDGETLQHAGGALDWPEAIGSHLGSGETDRGQWDAEVAVPYVAGAAMAIRTELFRAIGLLDAGFTPAYYEDTDFCFRARAAGYEVIYTPRARLVHYEGTSLEKQSPAHHRAYHRNRLRFVLKHAPVATLLHEFPAAEHAAIRRWSLSDSLARKRAYLHAILAVPEIGARRPELTPAVVSQLLASLQELHGAVVAEERRGREGALRASGPERTVPANDDLRRNQ